MTIEDKLKAFLDKEGYEIKPETKITKPWIFHAYHPEVTMSILSALQATFKLVKK